MSTPFGDLQADRNVVMRGNLGDYQNLGVKWIRTNFWWDAIEAAQGYHNWADWDNVIGTAASMGFTMVAQLGGIPSWVSASGGFSNPANVNAFASFAAAVAQHFAGAVRFFEVWNEPNIANTWTPSQSRPAEYVNLLQSANNAIKSVNSGYFVITGGLSPTPTSIWPNYMSVSEWMSAFYAAGGRGHYDAIGFHPYTYPLMPNDTAPWNGWVLMSNDLRNAMTSNGDSKPVWMTEFGAPTAGGGNALTEQQQSDMLIQAVDYMDSHDWLGPLFWYSYQDQTLYQSSGAEKFFGLVNSTWGRKWAWYTYRQLSGSGS